MRLWHKDFISVLPREQLVAQWRELSAIAGSIQKKGTPNHILVNFVIDYPFDHFITYANIVRTEMTKRGYKTNQAVFDKIVSLKPNWETIDFEGLYKEKMDFEYLTICFYNLREKALCGGFPKNDAIKIYDLYFAYKAKVENELEESLC